MKKDEDKELTHSAASRPGFQGGVKKCYPGSTLGPRPELGPGSRRVDLANGYSKAANK